MLNSLKRFNDVVIISAIRAPIGIFKSITATKLGSIVIESAIKQARIPKEVVDEVILGNVISAGLGQAPARQAAIFAGLPTSVCCTTVCSELKSVSLAAQSLMLGSNVIIAGGMDSMSHVPYYLKRGPTPYGGIKLIDGIVSDGNDLSKIHMELREELNISQKEQDEYEILSYKKFLEALKNKKFLEEITPIKFEAQRGTPEVVISEDDEQRVNFDKSGKLVITDNTSRFYDTASALVLMSAQAAEKHKCKPLARIVGFAEASSPAFAIRKLLKKTGVKKEDVKLWEIEPAFVLATIKLMELDIDKVNVNGGVRFGAISHLVHNLKKEEIGCACNYDGAIMLEKLDNSAYELPKITLYSHQYCTLCDELEEELENKFQGRYLLEKINITQKENIKFLRLYRYDIPVCFLNDQFLCMHKLNVELLDTKLKEFEDNSSK